MSDPCIFAKRKNHNSRSASGRRLALREWQKCLRTRRKLYENCKIRVPRKRKRPHGRRVSQRVLRVIWPSVYLKNKKETPRTKKSVSAPNQLISTSFDAGSSEMASAWRETAVNHIFFVFGKLRSRKITPKLQNKGPQNRETFPIFNFRQKSKNRHSRSAAALKPPPQAGFNAAALREKRFLHFLQFWLKFYPRCQIRP